MLTVILFISWWTIEDQKINLSSILKITVNMEVTHPELGYAGYQRPERPVLKIEYVVLKFKAVRSCVFWLSDNWQYIHQNIHAFSVFRYVSSMLKAAPTDHQTREKIVTGVNAFVAFIKIFDKSGIYYQEGDTNE